MSVSILAPIPLCISFLKGNLALVFYYWRVILHTLYDSFLRNAARTQERLVELECASFAIDF